jgi:hypothetical protein
MKMHPFFFARSADVTGDVTVFALPNMPRITTKFNSVRAPQALSSAMEEYISQIVNPLLQYLKASLPPPLYSFIVNGLSYTLTAVTAIARLSRTLIDKNPSEWNTTAMLPPIITILAAYMALASLYRTASWMIRITIFFLKWGSIIGIVMVIAQYFASDGRQNQGGNGRGIFVGLSEGGISNRNKYRQSTKPKPWDSFKTHEEWQYEQRRETRVAHSQRRS